MRTDYRHPMLGTVALFFKVTERDVTLMLREAGVTVDGRIYYEDFLKIMAGQISQQQNAFPCCKPQKQKLRMV